MDKEKIQEDLDLAQKVCTEIRSGNRQAILDLYQSESERFAWETLFEQATEDISTYHWAVEVWSDPPEGYTPGYLSILLLSHRARSQQALNKMQGPLPGRYTPYRGKINSLWLESEKKLKENVLPLPDPLKKEIGKEFNSWLEKLGITLKNIVQLAQDGDLLNDPDWVAEDLKEEGHDFILRFQDLALTREALREFLFLNPETQDRFNKKFANLEEKFRKSFGYFSPLKNILQSLKQREYDLDRWWLTRLPEEEDIQEGAILEDLLGKLKQAYQSQDLFPTRNCLDSELVIAYARDELSPEQNKKVESHIYQCRPCLELVLDVRLVEAEAREGKKKVVTLSPVLWKAIQEKRRHGEQRYNNTEQRIKARVQEQQQEWITRKKGS